MTWIKLGVLYGLMVLFCAQVFNSKMNSLKCWLNEIKSLLNG